MEKTPFAILFIGRQGSSYLQGLISSHPDAECEGELFAPGANMIADLVKRRTVAYRNSRCKTPAEYLKNLIARLSGTAVGFKMPFESIEQHPDVLDAFSQLNSR